MCTVSWIHDPGGYHLFANRDENKNRAPAAAPQMERVEGVRFLAPLDPDGGGTWIAANEYGISLCLLNGANLSERPAAAPESPARSRGLVVRDLIMAGSSAEFRSRLLALDLARVAPFTILALETGRPAMAGEWNGTDLVIVNSAEAYMPLASSSYDGAGARRRRRRELREMAESEGGIDSGLLFEFHSSHGNGADAYSTCMHRPDAETVSFSHVRVTPEEIRFWYSPAAPCKLVAPEERAMRRAA